MRGWFLYRVCLRKIFPHLLYRFSSAGANKSQARPPPPADSHSDAQRYGEGSRNPSSVKMDDTASIVVPTIAYCLHLRKSSSLCITLSLFIETIFAERTGPSFIAKYSFELPAVCAPVRVRRMEKVLGNSLYLKLGNFGLVSYFIC